jgi:hypothetical protein
MQDLNSSEDSMANNRRVVQTVDSALLLLRKRMEECMERIVQLAHDIQHALPV